MGSGKLFGSLIGLIGGGPIGALAGYVLGSLYDYITDDNDSGNQKLGASKDQRNNFIFCLMILSADVIQSDGKIMQSEMEYLHNFLKRKFGDETAKEGEKIILKLFERRTILGQSSWKAEIADCCKQMVETMPSEQRLRLINYLVDVAKVDGNISKEEIESLKNIAILLGLGSKIIDQILGLGGDSLDDAYKALGITKDATDDEVRKAYKQMAIKHHPDLVANLGPDIRKAAEEKFKEISNAKDRIYKSRGIK